MASIVINLPELLLCMFTCKFTCKFSFCRKIFMRYAAIDIDIVMDHDCYNGYNQIHVDDVGYVKNVILSYYFLIHTIYFFM